MAISLSSCSILFSESKEINTDASAQNTIDAKPSIDASSEFLPDAQETTCGLVELPGLQAKFSLNGQNELQILYPSAVSDDFVVNPATLLAAFSKLGGQKGNQENPIVNINFKAAIGCLTINRSLITAVVQLHFKEINVF